MNRHIAAVAAVAVSLLTPFALQSQSPAAPPRAPVAETDLFAIFADPDVNLHHLLYHWARAENGGAQVEVPEQGHLDRLSDEDRATWTEAVQGYWRYAGTRNVLFDDGMVALRDALVERAGPEGLSERDQRLYEALELARPVYERTWSEAHRRHNEAWIEALLDDLRTLEHSVADAITEAYGGTWPSSRVPVEVSTYANRVGGYTTADFHITISSTDPANAMPQGLELLFHEASHGESLEAHVHEGVGAAFAALGEEPPEQLWHTMLFYTAGETVRLAYAAEGRPGYRHYGEVTGLYRRRESRDRESTALAEHWAPFLRGETDREAALAAVARALVGPR